jgi:hypothetical protein
MTNLAHEYRKARRIVTHRVPTLINPIIDPCAMAVDAYMRGDSYGNPHIEPTFLCNMEDPQDLRDEFGDEDKSDSDMDCAGKLDDLFPAFDNSDIEAWALLAKVAPGC